MKTPKEFQPQKPKPKMWDKPPDSPKRTSMKNEVRLAEILGTKLTPGSGNQDMPSKKGDAQSDIFVFEFKETQDSKISIGVEVLGKVCREAAQMGKEPALVLSAYGLPDPLPKDWVILPASLFRNLDLAFRIKGLK